MGGGSWAKAKSVTGGEPSVSFTAAVGNVAYSPLDDMRNVSTPGSSANTTVIRTDLGPLPGHPVTDKILADVALGDTVKLQEEQQVICND